MVSKAALPGANDTDVQDLTAVRAVIEQAKGILMATYRCGPDDASDLLHKASRGFGVKVHVLAARLVDLAAQGRLALSQAKDRVAGTLHWYHVHDCGHLAANGDRATLSAAYMLVRPQTITSP